MTEREAEAYHLEQAAVLADTEADMLSAITMNYVEEATGIARAARRVGMPMAVSFTVETDGRLPTGQRLGDAIREVDDRTGGYPAYYMINCAHPTHFAPALMSGERWTTRIRGLRSNASRKSHAELNESAVLDIGDPAELARHHADLQRAVPHIRVMGGCCGTDHRHIEQIAAACAPAPMRGSVAA
jgi:S-methylmethionine-dependent homocysteine/selenocysteine methylase